MKVETGWNVYDVSVDQPLLLSRFESISLLILNIEDVSDKISKYMCVCVSLINLHTRMLVEVAAHTQRSS